jgi:hypothetical protein
LLCDRQDLNLSVDHSVDDAVRKAIEQVPLRTEEARPALRCFDNLRDRFVHREDELLAETAPAFLVEPRTKAESRIASSWMRWGFLGSATELGEDLVPGFVPVAEYSLAGVDRLRSLLDLARPCLLDFLRREAAVESSFQLVHEQLALLIGEPQGRFQDLFAAPDMP